LIEAADQSRLASPYADRLEFKTMDLTQPDLCTSTSRFVTALGVIEYFNATELDSLMSRMKAPYFLFDFPIPRDAEKTGRLGNCAVSIFGLIIVRACIFTSMMSSMR